MCERGGGGRGRCVGECVDDIMDFQFCNVLNVKVLGRTLGICL